MAFRSPDEIRVKDRTLAETVKQHRLWLESLYQQGERARLAEADLRQARLADCDLRLADLQNADLSGADLSRAKLNGADLRGANLRDAILSNADLTDKPAPPASASGGASPFAGHIPTRTAGVSVGGTDLTIAALPPELRDLVRPARCRGRARAAQKSGAALGLLLLAAVLLYTRTWDSHLLLAQALFSLPFADAPVTIHDLYAVWSPALALLYWGWLLRYLHPLLRRAAELPAVFPDAVSLAMRRDLWPVNVMAAEFMPRLREERGPVRRRWSYRAAALVLWWFAPVVAALLWWRFLPAHIAWISGLQVTATAAIAAGAAWSFREVAATYQAGRQEQEEDAPPPASGRKRAWQTALTVAALGALVTYGAIESNFARYFPVALEAHFGQFSPQSGQVGSGNFAAANAPDLSARNLRFAVISYSALAAADLRGARLENAVLSFCDLRGANLSGAHLRDGSLFSSQLDAANLERADLRGASLLCVSGLTDRQLAAALTDERTILPDGSRGPYQPGGRGLEPDRLSCADWRPGQRPGVEDWLYDPPLRLGNRPLPGISPPGDEALPEPDLGPIPELKPTPEADPPPQP